MTIPDYKKCGWSFSFQSKYKDPGQRVQEGRELQKLTDGDVTTQPGFGLFDQGDGGRQEVKCRFGEIGPDGEPVMICARLALKEIGRPLRQVRCDIDP